MTLILRWGPGCLILPAAFLMVNQCQLQEEKVAVFTEQYHGFVSEKVIYSSGRHRHIFSGLKVQLY